MCVFDANVLDEALTINAAIDQLNHEIEFEASWRDSFLVTANDRVKLASKAYNSITTEMTQDEGHEAMKQGDFFMAEAAAFRSDALASDHAVKMAREMIDMLVGFHPAEDYLDVRKIG